MRLAAAARRAHDERSAGRRREHRANHSGGVYALTVLTRVRAGAEHALGDRIADLEGRSPFANLPSTHFARFVLVPSAVFTAGQRQPRGRCAPWHLLFSSTFDGALEHYLDGLCTEVAGALQDIWQCCDGFPAAGLEDPGACKRYLRRHQLQTGLFFNAYPSASVADIRASLERRARLQTFVLRAQSLEPERLRDEFLQELGAVGRPGR